MLYQKIGDLLQDSWNFITKYPKLILIYFIFYSLLSSLLFAGFLYIYKFYLLDFLNDYLYSASPQLNIHSLIIPLIFIFLIAIIFFLLHTYLLNLIYSMIKLILKNGEFESDELFRLSKNKFFSLLFIQLIMGFLFLIFAGIVIIILYVLLLHIISLFDSYLSVNIPNLLILIFLIIISFLIFFYFSIRLALLIPVIYFEDLRIINTIKKAFSITKDHFFDVLLTFFILGLILIIPFYIGSYFQNTAMNNLIVNIGLNEDTIFYPDISDDIYDWIFAVIFGLISILITSCIFLFSSFYMFRAYQFLKKEKEFD